MGVAEGVAEGVELGAADVRDGFGAALALDDEPQAAAPRNNAATAAMVLVAVTAFEDWLGLSWSILILELTPGG